MAVDHYILRRAKDAGFTVSVVDTNVGNVLSSDPTGLTPATTYYFKVKAVDDAGNEGEFSDIGSQSTDHVTANVALASAGATITANVESLGAGTKARVINGHRNPQGDFAGTGGFQQNGNGNYIEITFSGSKTITEYDVITVNFSDFNGTTDPPNTTTTTANPLSDFTVQYWNGSAYVTIDTVTGNDKTWVQRSITPTTTTKMKFIWDTVGGGAAYLLEVECWGF